MRQNMHLRAFQYIPLFDLRHYASSPLPVHFHKKNEPALAESEKIKKGSEKR